MENITEKKIRLIFLISLLGYMPKEFISFQKLIMLKLNLMDNNGGVMVLKCPLSLLWKMVLSELLNLSR